MNVISHAMDFQPREDLEKNPKCLCLLSLSMRLIGILDGETDATAECGQLLDYRGWVVNF